MHDRSIRSRLRRRGAALLPVAAAALAFAPVAHAGTTQPVVYTPTTTAQLQCAISGTAGSGGCTTNGADNQPAGTLSIIQLSAGVQYNPTQSGGLVLSGNIEITGPPTAQVPANTQGQDPNVSGVGEFAAPGSPPLFTVNSGANVLFKGFDIQGGGQQAGIPAILVKGTAEIDNVTLEASTGTGIVVDTGASVRLVNSDLSDGNYDGLENNGSATLVHTTVFNNSTGGISGSNIKLYNSLLINHLNVSTGPANCTNTTGLSAAGNYADDSSCGSTGVTVNTGLVNYTNGTGFYGGPTLTTQMTSTSPTLGHASSTYCPTADQRFFLRSGATCDPGSYQSTGTKDTSTTGPSCNPQTPVETTTPQTMTVNAQEASGIGLGPDAVNHTITSDGTVSYATVGSTWFNATAPADTWMTDFPSNGSYGVTATKDATHNTVGDTKWSFYATDWLGNTSYCN